MCYTSTPHFPRSLKKVSPALPVLVHRLLAGGQTPEVRIFLRLRSQSGLRKTQGDGMLTFVYPKGCLEYLEAIQVLALALAKPHLIHVLQKNH